MKLNKLFFTSDVQLSDTDPYPDSIATQLASKIGSQIVFDAGDLVEHAYVSEYERYKGLFPYAKGVPGNHDLYDIGIFPYPRTVSYQGLSEGIHVVGFDTAYRLDTTQMAWLSATLADGNTPTILYLHHPLFSANTRVGGRGLTDIIRAAFLPIVQNTSVDLVISGHGHAYERHIYNKKTFIVAGTGGAHLDTVGTSSTLVKGISSHGWLEVRRSVYSLQCEFKNLDGVVLDSFSAGPISQILIEGPNIAQVE